MTDYSDVIFLMGAMLVYSMLSITTSRSYQIDNMRIYNAEAEYRAVSAGQAVIDELKWNVIEDVFRSNNNQYYFKNYPKNIDVSYGDKKNGFTSTLTVNGSTTLMSDVNNIRKYLVKVSVEDQNSPGSSKANFEFIKSFAYSN